MPSSAPSAGAPSWSVFDAFRAPALGPQVPISWESVAALVAAGATLTAPTFKALHALLEESERGMSCKDPLRDDWDRFRPLRASREEDWSDWLAYLLEASRSGVLASILFGDSKHAAAWVGVRAKREVWAARKRFRADLVIERCDGGLVHVEVKVGDRNYDKTPMTAAALEADMPGSWTHWLLDLDTNVPGSLEWRPAVSIVTWEAVAIGLRCSLIGDRENLEWCAWARAFCGSIEQKLLGFLRVPTGGVLPPNPSRLNVVLRSLAVLRAAGELG